MKNLIVGVLLGVLLILQSPVWADEDKTIEAYNWRIHIVTTVIKSYEAVNGITVGIETTTTLTSMVHLDGTDILAEEVPVVGDEVPKGLITLFTRKDANSEEVILEPNTALGEGMKELLILVVETKEIGVSASTPARNEKGLRPHRDQQELRLGGVHNLQNLRQNELGSTA